MVGTASNFLRPLGDYSFGELPLLTEQSICVLRTTSVNLDSLPEPEPSPAGASLRRERHVLTTLRSETVWSGSVCCVPTMMYFAFVFFLGDLRSAENPKAKSILLPYSVQLVGRTSGQLHPRGYT